MVFRFISRSYKHNRATDLIVGGSYTIQLRLSDDDYYDLTAYIVNNTSTIDIPGAEAVKKAYTFTCTDSVTLTIA